MLSAIVACPFLCIPSNYRVSPFYPFKAGIPRRVSVSAPVSLFTRCSLYHSAAQCIPCLACVNANMTDRAPVASSLAFCSAFLHLAKILHSHFLSPLQLSTCIHQARARLATSLYKPCASSWRSVAIQYCAALPAIVNWRPETIRDGGAHLRSFAQSRPQSSPNWHCRLSPRFTLYDPHAGCCQHELGCFKSKEAHVYAHQP